MVKKTRKMSFGEIIFDIFNMLFLLTISIMAVYPFLRVLAVSLSPPYALSAFPLSVIPRNFTLESYMTILKDDFIVVGFKNSVIITAIGSVADVIITAMVAYALSKKRLPHRTFFTFFCVFTMFFGAGLIPGYLNIRSFGLIDNYAVLIVPRLINTYSMLICRNFFMSISPEIEESAAIDGANDITVLFRLILPISKPIIVTLLLWYGVARWNSYMDCLLYITDPKKFTLSVVLRNIINWGTTERAEGDRSSTFNVELVRASTIMIATIPIMMVYPFIQKYFVKGIMIGSIKG